MLIHETINQEAHRQALLNAKNQYFNRSAKPDLGATLEKARESLEDAKEKVALIYARLGLEEALSLLHIFSSWKQTREEYEKAVANAEYWDRIVTALTEIKAEVDEELRKAAERKASFKPNAKRAL